MTILNGLTQAPSVYLDKFGKNWIVDRTGHPDSPGYDREGFTDPAKARKHADSLIRWETFEMDEADELRTASHLVRNGIAVSGDLFDLVELFETTLKWKDWEDEYGSIALRVARSIISEAESQGLKFYGIGRIITTDEAVAQDWAQNQSWRNQS